MMMLEVNADGSQVWGGGHSLVREYTGTGRGIGPAGMVAGRDGEGGREVQWVGLVRGVEAVRENTCNKFVLQRQCYFPTTTLLP